MWSCSQPNATTDESKNLSDQELELRSKLEQTAKILTELVTDSLVVKELQLATNFARLNGRDEDVTFPELLYDNAEYKIELKAKNRSSIGVFRDRFREYAKIKSKSNNKNIDPELEAYLVANNVKIYFPYSENWEGEEDINPTISFDPIDNKDENEGYINSKSHYKSVNSFETVLVNDEYAYKNPSFIILVCDELVPIYKMQTNYALGCGGGFPNPPPPGDDTEPGEFDINQVLIGEAKLTSHYDGLFAGGSEIRWNLTDAVKYTPEQTSPELAVALVTKNFSRKDIRKKRWKNIYTHIDHDWEDYELAKELYIWEADEGDNKIDFSLGISVKILGAAVSFNTNAKVDKKRDDIYRGFITRKSFYNSNRLDVGHELRGGFQVRKAGDLYYYFKEIGINVN
jgi:hypothetical protein